jgi:hypothetical protein
MTPEMRLLATLAGVTPIKASSRDSERRNNPTLAHLVDVGIKTYDTGNWNAAREFFETHRVPATTAVRVLFHRTQRRRSRSAAHA